MGTQRGRPLHRGICLLSSSAGVAAGGARCQPGPAGRKGRGEGGQRGWLLPRGRAGCPWPQAGCPAPRSWASTLSGCSLSYPSRSAGSNAVRGIPAKRGCLGSAEPHTASRQRLRDGEPQSQGATLRPVGIYLPGASQRVAQGTDSITQVFPKAGTPIARVSTMYVNKPAHSCRHRVRVHLMGSHIPAWDKRYNSSGTWSKQA